MNVVKLFPAACLLMVSLATCAAAQEGGGAARDAARVRSHYIVFEIDAADHVNPILPWLNAREER